MTDTLGFLQKLRLRYEEVLYYAGKYEIGSKKVVDTLNHIIGHADQYHPASGPEEQARLTFLLNKVREKAEVLGSAWHTDLSKTSLWTGWFSFVRYFYDLW